MTRAVALIDGEHYPPVVRFALERLAETADVVAAVFVGGAEKVGQGSAEEAYGVPVLRGGSAAETLSRALVQYEPDAVVDLSDEPVLSSADRFRLASIALAAGVSYRGADFVFDPPREGRRPDTPVLAIVGTGKRVGKTAVSAYVARRLKAAGRDVVVLAMGRGGPAEPELIRGDEVALTTADLLGLVQQGKHASSDNYEDAVMARVTTVGCRRCGGGMAGETFFDNVDEGVRLADGLGKELLVAEGSGAAMPPVAADARLLVIGSAMGPGYVTDYFGPMRVAVSDAAVVVAPPDEPEGGPGAAAVRDAVRSLAPGMPCAVVTFRPRPLAPVAGRDVFFATTAPEPVVPALVRYLEAEHGCRVAGVSRHLSDRTRLRDDLAAAAGRFDLLLTELKAAAVDVVVAEGERAGVESVLCDNEPVPVGGDDLDALLDAAAALALERGTSRRSA